MCSILFPPLLASIDVSKHCGKEFLFTGKVKLADGPGSGHLWARVDRANAKVGFFENMSSRPIRANEWHQYEINGIIDTDGVSLAFGCFLQTAGKLFVDDIHVKVKDGEEWKTVYLNSFETDNSDVAPNSMYAGKSAGYKTLVTENESGEGKKSVCIQSVNEEVKSGSLFEAFCRIGEYVKKEIGSGLTILMPLAVYGNEKATYPKADETKLLALRNELKQMPAASTKDLHTRIGDLIIMWNIFQHFYPYFKETKTDWSEAFRSAVKDAYSNQTEYEFLKTIRRFTAKLKDGHVWVNSPSITGMEDFVLPIQWEWVANQLVVTKVMHDTLSVKKGDRILAIDGQSPQKYFEEIYAHISAATSGWRDSRAQVASLQGPENSKIALTVSSDKGKRLQTSLVRKLALSQYYQLISTNDEPLKRLSQDIYYIHLGMASMEQIKTKMDTLQQAKAIICDLRGYPNNNHELISHFMTQKDTSTRWMRIPKIIYPDQENITEYKEMGWSMQPLSPHLTAKVFFLIDGRAISYAESYMSFIEHYKLATIIGQPTAGTNGNVNTITLPGAIQVSWTGMKVVKHDGSQHHGIGILPSVYVTKTIKGIQENRDPFLDKAIELATKKIERIHDKK